MKLKKQNVGLKNTSVGKTQLPDSDIMISQLLQDKQVRQSFVNASIKDGVPNSQIKNQLKYFGVNYLIN